MKLRDNGVIVDQSFGVKINDLASMMPAKVAELHKQVARRKFGTITFSSLLTDILMRHPFVTSVYMLFSNCEHLILLAFLFYRWSSSKRPHTTQTAAWSTQLRVRPPPASLAVSGGLG